NLKNSSANPEAFEFLNIPPGTWTMESDTRFPPFNQYANVDRSLIPSAQVTFRVTNANIDGLTISIGRGHTIQGHIHLDDITIPATLPNLDRTTVSLVGSLPIPGVIAARERPDA